LRPRSAQAHRAWTLGGQQRPDAVNPRRGLIIISLGLLGFALYLVASYPLAP
jgi:hypothetical protein